MICRVETKKCTTLAVADLFGSVRACTICFSPIADPILRYPARRTLPEITLQINSFLIFKISLASSKVDLDSDSASNNTLFQTHKRRFEKKLSNTKKKRILLRALFMLFRVWVDLTSEKSGATDSRYLTILHAN